MMTKEQELRFRENYPYWADAQYMLLLNGSVDLIREFRHILKFDRYNDYKSVVIREDLQKDFKEEIDEFYDIWGNDKFVSLKEILL